MIIAAADCASIANKPLDADQANKLWQNLDRYSSGAIGVNVLSHWLLEVAGYSAPLEMLESLLNLPAGQPYVHRDKFMIAIAQNTTKEQSADIK